VNTLTNITKLFITGSTKCTLDGSADNLHSPADAAAIFVNH